RQGDDEGQHRGKDGAIDEEARDHAAASLADRLFSEGATKASPILLIFFSFSSSSYFPPSFSASCGPNDGMGFGSAFTSSPSRTCCNAPVTTRSCAWSP